MLPVCLLSVEGACCQLERCRDRRTLQKPPLPTGATHGGRALNTRKLLPRLTGALACRQEEACVRVPGQESVAAPSCHLAVPPPLQPACHRRVVLRVAGPRPCLTPPVRPGYWG